MEPLGVDQLPDFLGVGGVHGGSIAGAAGEEEALQGAGQLQSRGLARQLQQLRCGEVGLHMLQEQGHIVREMLGLGEGPFQHGGQQLPLHRRPIQIPVGIAVQGVPLAVGGVPEEGRAQGLRSVQQLNPRIQVDVDVLSPILVVHVLGHVELHAAHGVHQLHKALGIDDDIVVDGIAQQAGRLGPEGLHAVFGVDIVQMGQGAAVGDADGVDLGVPGEGQQADGLFPAVVGNGHHAVGEVGGGAGGGQQEGVHSLPPLQLAGAGGLGHAGAGGAELTAPGEALGGEPEGTHKGRQKDGGQHGGPAEGVADGPGPARACGGLLHGGQGAPAPGGGGAQAVHGPAVVIDTAHVHSSFSASFSFFLARWSRESTVFRGQRRMVPISSAV